MKEIAIYEFQLKTIIETLRLTSNYNHSSRGETCYDRQVRQAYEFAKNALAGEKDKEVKYIGGEYSDTSPKQATDKCDPNCNGCIYQIKGNQCELDTDDDSPCFHYDHYAPTSLQSTPKTPKQVTDADIEYQASSCISRANNFPEWMSYVIGAKWMRKQTGGKQ